MVEVTEQCFFCGMNFAFVSSHFGLELVGGLRTNVEG